MAIAVVPTETPRPVGDSKTSLRNAGSQMTRNPTALRLVPPEGVQAPRDIAPPSPRVRNCYMSPEAWVVGDEVWCVLLLNA